MGEGRQALNVDSEQARERICLSVTELRKLGCDVLHRAVPLAELHSGQRCTSSHWSGGGGETVGGQCRCQHLGSGGDVPPCSCKPRGIHLLELCDALAGKLADSICTRMVGEVAQRRGGHVVIVTVQSEVTGLGQDVGARWSSAPTTASRGRLVFLDRAVVDEQVKVSAHSGWRQSQTGRQVGRGKRAILGDGLSDQVSRARLKNVWRGVGPLRTFGNGTVGDKHKNIVT